MSDRQKTQRSPGRAWCLGVLAALLVLLAGAAALNAWVDPFFHYRAPREGIAYDMSSERYTNDGILKHFEYDAVIIGSSVTMNFKTSLCDTLFGCRAVKVPHPNAVNRELYDDLRIAFSANDGIRLVFYGMDYASLLIDKDQASGDYVAPAYLRDGAGFNDLSYLLNKDVLLQESLHDLRYTAQGGHTTSFDAYKTWNYGSAFSAGNRLSLDYSGDPSPVQEGLDEAERRQTRENVAQNILSLAEEHPDTVFYVFVSPHSIVRWYSYSLDGLLRKYIEAEQEAFLTLQDCPNVRFFSFFDDFETVCTLDNYMDAVHYGQWVNDQLLDWMHEGAHQLTAENQAEYYAQILDYYLNYDYVSLIGR